MNDIVVSLKDYVGIVEINRPPNNFFDTPLISAIGDALEHLAAEGMRSILLCAAGKNFCAGANFARPAADNGGSDDDHIHRHAVRLFRCPLPIVAAVQGAAIGGGLGLALAADFRVGSESSRLSANFNRLGFHPGFGLSVTLPRAIGIQKAALMFYTGHRLSGADAFAQGLFDVLAADDALRDTALDLATEIARSAPLAVQSTRLTLRGDLADRVAAATEHERREQEKHFATADFTEGVKAMAERRLPVFSGV